MSTDKKKGDFDQWQKEDVGGDKKAQARGETASRTGGKQNQGSGGRP